MADDEVYIGTPFEGSNPNESSSFFRTDIGAVLVTGNSKISFAYCRRFGETELKRFHDPFSEHLETAFYERLHTAFYGCLQTPFYGHLQTIL